eukprot:538979_1
METLMWWWLLCIVMFIHTCYSSPVRTKENIASFGSDWERGLATNNLDLIMKWYDEDAVYCGNGICLTGLDNIQSSLSKWASMARNYRTSTVQIMNNIFVADTNRVAGEYFTDTMYFKGDHCEKGKDWMSISGVCITHYNSRGKIIKHQWVMNEDELNELSHRYDVCTAQSDKDKTDL